MKDFSVIKTKTFVACSRDTYNTFYKDYFVFYTGTKEQCLEWINSAEKVPELFSQIPSTKQLTWVDEVTQGVDEVNKEIFITNISTVCKKLMMIITDKYDYCDEDEGFCPDEIRDIILGLGVKL